MIEGLKSEINDLKCINVSRETEIRDLNCYIDYLKELEPVTHVSNNLPWVTKWSKYHICVDEKLKKKDYLAHYWVQGMKRNNFSVCRQIFILKIKKIVINVPSATHLMMIYFINHGLIAEKQILPDYTNSVCII